MIRIILTALYLFLCIASSTYSQGYDDCATEDSDTAIFKRLPWFDNNQYIDNFIDSIGYPLAGGGDPSARVEGSNIVRYRIPVNFIVYRDDNGNGGPNSFQLQRLMDRLNEDHRANNTGIRFYQKCNVSYVNDSDRLRINGGFGTWWSGITPAEAVYDEMLNVHIVESINATFKPDPDGRYNLLAEQSVFINRSVYANDIDARVLTHEVGHFLKLDHTHQFQSWRGWPYEDCVVEPVDRSRRFADINLCFDAWFANNRKCESTGDGLCDTPADPKIDDNEELNCAWIGDLDDIYGDSYLNPPSGSRSPDPHNIMSYGERGCRDHFSRQQIGVMVHSIVRGRHVVNGIDWRIPNVIFDTFEPDNEFATARQVAINDLDEHRTFHQTCDEDWVSFTAVAGRLYTILTKQIAGQANADTELFLYRNDAGVLTLLQSHNDISASNRFSQIATTLSAGEYVVRVVRRNPSGTQHYGLQVSDFCYNFVNAAYSLTDQSVVCASEKVFALQNRFPGSTILWSNSANVTYVSGQGTDSYRVRAASSTTSGAGWVRATTSFNGCVDITLPDETFWVGKPATPQPIVVNASDCPEYYFSTACVNQGITSYTWQYNKLPSGTIYTYPNSTCDSRRLVLNSGFSYNVGVKAINGCGESSFRTTSVTVSCGGARFAVYPNPTSQEITFEWESDLKPQSSNEITVVLLDDVGNEKLRVQKKGTQIKFNIAGFPKGQYYYKAKRGDEIKEGRLLVE